MKVTLKNVRLSFPDLFEAVQYEGQGPFKYRASFLIEPGSANDIAVREAISAVAKERWGAKAEAALKAIESNPQKFAYVDGNTKSYDGYEGMVVLTASRSQEDGRPLVIDRDKTPLTAADGKPYAGCFVNAAVEIWAQDNNWGKGIRAQLGGVQFSRDGDSFKSVKPTTVDEFDALGEDEEDSLV